MLPRQPVRTSHLGGASAFLKGAVIAILLAAVSSYLAMLVFGAFLSYHDITGPGYFETAFGLASVTFIGGAFTATLTGGGR